jgi:transcriptional regulator with XRE-family HTH domain
LSRQNNTISSFEASDDVDIIQVVKTAKDLLRKNTQRLREDLEIGQDELAARAKISEGMIKKIEQGVTNPSLETLDKLVTGLGATHAELFADEPSTALSAIPPEVWSGWRKLNAEGKALCLYILTENALFFDFLPEPKRAELLAVLRTLHLKLPDSP